MRTHALALVALLFTACGGARSPKPPPDLSSVQPAFHPSQATLGQAIGVAGPLPMTPATLDRLQASGATFVRSDFLWEVLEPQQGAFDFAKTDAAVDAIRARGLGVVGILAYNVAWATPTGDDHAPPDPDRYAAFVEATARHFAGRVAAWEIWNEENLGFRFWKPTEDAPGYAAVLERAYAAVKRGDSHAQVILGGLNAQGLSSTGEDFLADAYFAVPNLGQSFDALGFHPYPRYPPQAAPEADASGDPSLPRKLARMQAELGYFGDGSRPIWVTELGWPVYGTVDEGAQARFTVRSAVLALAAGADRIAFYTLDDGPNPSAFPPEDAFGLYRSDGTPKPSRDALAQLIATDPSARVVDDLSDANNRAYRLSGDKGKFVVRWPIDPTGDATITKE